MPRRDAPVAQVPARYLAALLQRLEAEGLSSADASAALSEAGIERARLDAHEAWLTRAEQTAALQALARRSQRSDLGVLMGLSINLGRVDLVGQMLLNAHSLHDGFQRLAPFFALVTPAVRLQVLADAGGLRARFSLAHPLPYDVAVMLLEAVVVSAHRLMGFIRQEPATPCQLRLAWPAPPHAALYRTLSGAVLGFGLGGTPEAELRLSPEIAEARLPMADDAAMAEAERRCAERLRELKQLRGLGAWLRWLVYATEERQPTQAEAAALLGVSERTLSRLLAAEGGGFGRIAREVRHAKACELLAQPAPTLAAIAHRLGYTDGSNFSRAFKAMAGVTPGEYRDRLAAPPPGS
jgi:AraC-like DNA-binding protein